jgi:hypothetical protein
MDIMHGSRLYCNLPWKWPSQDVYILVHIDVSYSCSNPQRCVISLVPNIDTLAPNQINPFWFLMMRELHQVNSKANHIHDSWLSIKPLKSCVLSHIVISKCGDFFSPVIIHLNIKSIRTWFDLLFVTNLSCLRFNLM